MGTGGGPAPPTWDRSRGRHSGARKMIYVAGLCCHEGPDITRQVRLVDHPRPPRFCGLSLFPACIEWQVGRGGHISATNGHFPNWSVRTPGKGVVSAGLRDLARPRPRTLAHFGKQDPLLSTAQQLHWDLFSTRVEGGPPPTLNLPQPPARGTSVRPNISAPALTKSSRHWCCIS